MSFPEHLHERVNRVEDVRPSTDAAARLIGMIDHTIPSQGASSEAVKRLCHQAVTPYGNVAAICVPPRFIETARYTLQNQTLRIAAFSPLPEAERCEGIIEDMLNAGAQELDLQFPAAAFLAGRISQVRSQLRQARSAARGGATLKIILETGTLGTYEQIRDAASLSLEQGVDFLQTASPGHPQGTNLLAAATLIEAIQEYRSHMSDTGAEVGLKIAGGVATVQDAISYLMLTEEMTEAPVTAQTFRIGAVQLLEKLLAFLSPDAPSDSLNANAEE